MRFFWQSVGILHNGKKSCPIAHMLPTYDARCLRHLLQFKVVDIFKISIRILGQGGC